MFQAIAEGNVDSGGSLVPTTCECCHGLGFILAAPELRPHREEEPPASDDEDEDISVIGQEDSDSEDDADAASPAVAPAAIPALPQAAAQPVVVPAIAQTVVPPVVTSVAIQTAASTAPATTAQPPGPAPVLATGPAQGGAPLAVVIPAFVPSPSPILPGLASLLNTAPPAPADAVYCDEGAARYYTITRGLRVGVYEGWQNVAPYVVGAANANYSRHGSIRAAYNAYVTAYTRNFVAYI